jgi:DNA polymerase-3 subunit gamma/tau
MLYNKYRPLTFDDVCGQEAAKVLKNQVLSDKVGHAYLFTGVRGTGKTTCAKILARVVNCISPVNGSPCGICESCKTSLDNTNPDIMEIDGASNNGVDNVRDLIKNVTYSALNKVKVYIIDEVHMLSMPAFNAMLKTLEEPPANTLFIFATTEKTKVPATIKSRCQILDFTNIAEEDIFNRAKFVIENEGFKCTEEGVRLLSKEANGSLRDALSILESLNGEVTKGNIENSLGLISFEKISELYNSLVKSDKMGSLRLALKFLKSGVLGQEVIERLSQLAVENLLNIDFLETNELILSESILAVNNIRAGLSDRSVLMHFIIKVCQSSGVKAEVSAKKIMDKVSDEPEDIMEDTWEEEFIEDYPDDDDEQEEDLVTDNEIDDAKFDIPDMPNCYQGSTNTTAEEKPQPKQEDVDHDLGIRVREVLFSLSPTIKQLVGSVIVENRVINIRTDLFGKIFLEENLGTIKEHLQHSGIQNVISISVD